MKKSLPLKIQKMLTSLAFVLAPPSAELDMAGIQEKIIERANRMIFELSKLFRYGFIMGAYLFEWFPVLFGYGLSSFSNISSENQKKYVDSWAKSRLIPCREFFKTLKALVCLIYFSDKRVWEYIGYDPEPHMRERIAVREEILAKSPQPPFDKGGQGGI